MYIINRDDGQTPYVVYETTVAHIVAAIAAISVFIGVTGYFGLSANTCVLAFFISALFFGFVVVPVLYVYFAISSVVKTEKARRQRLYVAAR